MIKLGLQSLSYRDTFIAGKIDMFGFLQRAADMRLDGVDLHYTHFESTDDAYLERIKLFCLRAGLHLSYIGVSNDFGKTGEELERQKSLVKHWVDVAERMGIPMVRNFGAWLPEGEAEEEVWSRLIAAQKEVTAYARSKGVVIGLHNHNHGCVPATGDQTLRLLDAVDDDYYTHILDVGQYRGSPGASGARGRPDPAYDFYGSIATSAPRAVHVRAKIYRIASGEEKWLDYDRIMPILRDVSFNGWMSIVFEGQDELDEPAAVPLAVTYIRSMLAKYEL
ncbi:MAG: sugar phosphate isomerase/epimerase [Chloroflexi bacterium]|nr:sugar phosphate isomerase/epimerase [Chloroflexota bacterium]